LHNVHEKEPVLFETRWTLSYLRGPLGRDELRRLIRSAGADSVRTAAADSVRSAGASAPASQTGMATAGADSVRSAGASAPASQTGMATAGVGSVRTAGASAPASSSTPILDPAIKQYFAPGTGATYEPCLVGVARVTYSNRALDVDET